MEATGVIMADYVELINPQTMTCKLLCNGELVEEYAVDRCDKCELIKRKDAFGWQKGAGGEKLMWFCGACR